MPPSSSTLMESPSPSPSRCLRRLPAHRCTSKPGQQQINGHTYTLLGEVTVHYRDYILRADKVSYNQDTGDIEADGHLQDEGGPDDEMIQADHGTINVDVDSARFFDVIGTVGVRMNATRRKVVYTGVNPFIFTGRVVIQEGRNKFRIIDGTMTTCRLPHPDWRITAGRIMVGEDTASAKNAGFRLLNSPSSTCLTSRIHWARMIARAAS